MKVSELEGAQLDFWVAKAEASGFFLRIPFSRLWLRVTCKYSGRWKYGGPIIERERISIDSGGTPCIARTVLRPVSGPHMAPCYRMEGPTPLIAAMRAYVASKFGDEVPDQQAA